MTGTSAKDSYRFPTIWTPEMDRVLCEMYNTGKSARIIGEHFGVSRNSIIGRMTRLRAKNQLPELTLEMQDYKRQLGVAARVARQMNQPPKPVKPVAPRSFTFKSLPRLVTPPCPPPPPKQEVVKVASVEKSNGTAAAILMDIKPNGCRWIEAKFRYGDGDKALMCGDPKKEDSAFCSHHHAMAYISFSVSEKAKRQRTLLRTGHWAAKR